MEVRATSPCATIVLYAEHFSRSSSSRLRCNSSSKQLRGEVDGLEYRLNRFSLECSALRHSPVLKYLLSAISHGTSQRVCSISLDVAELHWFEDVPIAFAEYSA